MLYKGIWTDDLSYNNIKRLFNKGFNTLLLQMGFFWQGDGDTHQAATERMHDKYLEAKKLGYKYFLIDLGWGMGRWEPEGHVNDFYRVVFDKFKRYNDVLFYCGEFIEEMVESGKINLHELEEMIKDRCEMTGMYRIIFDSTKRNHKTLHGILKDVGYFAVPSISSYYNQDPMWKNGMLIAWYYGQLKIDATLNFDRMNKKADECKIYIRLLYQADGSFKWNQPATWINGFLKLIGLYNRMIDWQQNRFLKSCA